MYEMQGKIKDVSIDYRTNKAFLTLAIDNKQLALNCYDHFHLEEKLALKIDKYREKRSLNANNYAWKLLTEIANIVRASKEEIYLKMLKRYGQSVMISVEAHIPFTEYYKYFDEAGEGTVNGKLFKHYKIYKGSSEFDKQEMAIFLDGIISEAKDMGIVTETPDQIAKMKSLWGE